MSAKRQKIRSTQLHLAFTEGGWGEIPNLVRKGTEAQVAKRNSESLAMEERLMEEVSNEKILK